MEESKIPQNMLVHKYHWFLGVKMSEEIDIWWEIEVDAVCACVTGHDWDKNNCGTRMVKRFNLGANTNPLVMTA